MEKYKKSAKYQDIYLTAKKLFWKYGIKKVSIKKICKEAGASKMTFYKFFPNKIELAKNILKDIVDDAIIKSDKIVNSNLLFQEKVIELINLKLQGVKDISIEFITDIYKIEDLQAIMNKSNQKLLNIFVNFLKDSQEKEMMRQDIKIDFILSLLNQMTLMMEDKQLLAKYDKPEDLILEAMNFLFYGLLTEK
ncbi:MAG: TetR/AcrR family transcriptional regulator [Bacteroidales bacterium]|nr:TetR/AcrR family transcriptional regulator [Bacteroidales bacterium]